MLRRIAAVSNLLMMLVVMSTTIVSHHHHGAMACFVKEVCIADGCCNDEHTTHSDADSDGNESHCVAHEDYCQSDDIRQHGIVAVAELPSGIFRSFSCRVAVFDASFRGARVLSPPPILSWRINC